MFKEAPITNLFAYVGTQVLNTPKYDWVLVMQGLRSENTDSDFSRILRKKVLGQENAVGVLIDSPRNVVPPKSVTGRTQAELTTLLKGGVVGGVRGNSKVAATRQVKTRVAPAGKLVLEVSVAPNLDYPPGLQGPNRSTNFYLAKDLKDASMLFRTLVTGLGGGNMQATSGNVYDDKGKAIAHVSYNGRVWEVDHMGHYTHEEIKVAGYTGNPGGKDIYPNDVQHGYGEPLAGGTDVMRKLQNTLLHEQGNDEWMRPESPRLASDGWHVELGFDDFKDNAKAAQLYGEFTFHLAHTNDQMEIHRTEKALEALHFNQWGVGLYTWPKAKATYLQLCAKHGVKPEKNRLASADQTLAELEKEANSGRTTHYNDPKKPGYSLCGQRAYPDTTVDSIRDTTCYYCKLEWERRVENKTWKTSRFEEGKPADPCQNMSDEDCKKWKDMNEEHRDNFKTAADWTLAELTKTAAVLTPKAVVKWLKTNLADKRLSAHDEDALHGELIAEGLAQDNNKDSLIVKKVLSAIREEMAWGNTFQGVVSNAKVASDNDPYHEERLSRFEEGVPADPTENMSDEDAKEWKKNTEEYGDKFKTASKEWHAVMTRNNPTFGAKGDHVKITEQGSLYIFTNTDAKTSKAKDDKGFNPVLKVRKDEFDIERGDSMYTMKKSAADQILAELEKEAKGAPTGWVVIKHTNQFGKDIVITKRPLASKEKAQEMVDKLDEHGSFNQHHAVQVGPNAPYELLDGGGIGGLGLFVRPRSKHASTDEILAELEKEAGMIAPGYEQRRGLRIGDFEEGEVTDDGYEEGHTLSGNPSLEGKRAGSEVGMTILQQMGGIGRIRAMLGVQQFLALPDGISFKWPSKQRSKGNAVRIILTPADTYTMEFYNGASKVKEYEDVYADMLIPIFEKQTGLYLKLGSAKKTAADEVLADLEIEARFEEGKPADPKEQMKTPEAKAKWEKYEGKVDKLAAELGKDITEEPAHDTASAVPGDPDPTREAMFEKGVKADPTKNMTPEQKAEWNKQKEEHKDEFKTAATIKKARISDDGTLLQLLKMEMENTGVSEAEARVTTDMKSAARNWEDVVKRNLIAWVTENLDKFKLADPAFGRHQDARNVVEVLMVHDGGAGFLYYLEMNGDGAGTEDGGWNHLFVDKKTIKELSLHMKPLLKSAFTAFHSAIENAAHDEASEANDAIKTAGRSVPVHYTVRLFMVFPGHGMTTEHWDKLYGKPNVINLKKLVEAHNKSLEPGGVNSHAGMMLAAFGGEIYDEFDNKKVVARWEDKNLIQQYKNRPSFEVLASDKTADGKWIQKAIKHPGALREHYNVPEGEDIPVGKMKADQKRLQDKEDKSDEESKLLKQINLALSLRKMGSEDKEAGLATGLYGFPKYIQADCDGACKKLARSAERIAKDTYRKDEKTAEFLATHSKRADSAPARLLVAALQGMSPKLASDRLEELRKTADFSLTPADKKVLDAFIDQKAATSKALSSDGKTLDGLWMGGNKMAEWLGGSQIKINDNGGKSSDVIARYLRKNTPKNLLKQASMDVEAAKTGLYGFHGRTAKLGLQACTDLHHEAGKIANDLHSRRAAHHEKITGFLNKHADEGGCHYSRMIASSYPEANSKTASSAPKTVAGWLALED